METKRNYSSTTMSNLLQGCYYGTPPINYKPKRIVSIDNKSIKCAFEDGKEIFVTVQEPDIFDERLGVAIAICTKMFGSKTKFYDYISKVIERPVKQSKKKKLN